MSVCGVCGIICNLIRISNSLEVVFYDLPVSHHLGRPFPHRFPLSDDVVVCLTHPISANLTITRESGDECEF